MKLDFVKIKGSYHCVTDRSNCSYQSKNNQDHLLRTEHSNIKLLFSHDKILALF